MCLSGVLRVCLEWLLFESRRGVMVRAKREQADLA